MNPRLRAVLALMVSTMTMPAQTANDPNEGSRVTYHPATQVATFAWWGKAGATYFVKFSEDLMTWSYLTSSFAGIGDIASANITTNSARLFFKLQYTTAPYTADFDGDGLENGIELTSGWDPLNRDTNSDGLWDGLAFRLGLDPGAADSDADGLSNEWERLLGTNPHSADSDGDGVNDGADLLPLDPDASTAGSGVTGAPVLTLFSPPGAVEVP